MRRNPERLPGSATGIPSPTIPGLEWVETINIEWGPLLSHERSPIWQSLSSCRRSKLSEAPNDPHKGTHTKMNPNKGDTMEKMLTFEEWDSAFNGNREETETTRRGWFNAARQG